MRIELVLGGAAVGVVAAMLVLTVAAPGVIASHTESNRTGRVAIEEVSISPGPASGATAVLEVDARLTHRGGPAENVTVEFRAVDAESGLVETVRRVEVGTLQADGERRVLANLSVARQGGYRIETVVYRDGRRVARGTKSVSGVGSLRPDYADVPVEFHRFEGADLPPIEYSVAASEGERVTLDVSTYVTNTGDAPVSDLRVVFKVRQSDSGIVAAEAAVDVGEIRPGRTVDPGAELTVPDGYNYYLDAVIWRDGVVVTSARAAAVLDPDQSITVNRTGGRDGLQVGDFQPGGGTETPDGGPGATEADAAESGDGGGGPGFGVAAAVVAFVVALTVLGRRYDD